MNTQNRDSANSAITQPSLRLVKSDTYDGPTETRSQTERNALQREMFPPAQPDLFADVTFALGFWR
jgi:hypothetical protein